MQSQIEEAAYVEARRQADGESVVVGMNRFDDDGEERIEPLRVDPTLERGQRERLAEWRSRRGPIDDHIGALVETAKGDDNLLPIMKEALAAGATVGEVSDALRSVFGSHR